MSAFDLLRPERVLYIPRSLHVSESLCFYCEDRAQSTGEPPRRIVVSHHTGSAGSEILDSGPHFITVRISRPGRETSSEDLRFGLADIRECEAVALAALIRRTVMEYQTFLGRELVQRDWFSLHQSTVLQRSAVTLSVSSTPTGRLACYLYGGPMQVSLGELSGTEMLRIAAALCGGWSFSDSTLPAYAHGRHFKSRWSSLAPAQGAEP